MDDSVFSKAQIALILHTRPRRDAGSGGVPQGRHVGCDVPQLEEALLRADAVGGQAHALARG